MDLLFPLCYNCYYYAAYYACTVTAVIKKDECAR